MRIHKQTAFWRDAKPTRETRAATRNAAERRLYDDVLMKRDEEKIEIKVA